MVMMVALARAPALGCTQCAPVAASTPQVLRDLGGLHTARSRQVGGFPILRCDRVLWSKEIQWRWRPVVAASVASGRSGAVSEMRTRPFRILISTGDLMGDMHGAALVRALIDAAGEEKVEIEVYAMDGKRMKDEGAVLSGDNTGLSSIGLLEALPLVIPSIQIQIRTRKFLKSRPPDLVVLIDYLGINIPFGKYAKKHFGEIEDSLRSSGNMKKMLETLLGAALSAHTKVLQKTPTLTSIKECASTFLGFANRHIQSGHVLKAVADYLEASFGPLQVEGQPREYPEELSAAAALKILAIASANLGSADKMLRLATLRVLSYFEPLSGLHEDDTQNDPKRQKRSNDLSKGREMNQASKLIQQLLSIEAAPLVLGNCRQSNLVVTHVKVDVSAGRIPEAYVVPLVHAMIGVLCNRFSVLWDPAMDCLAALVDTVGATSWDVVIAYLHSFQEDYLSQPVLMRIRVEGRVNEVWVSFPSSEGCFISILQ